jgi:hypothetical protein
VFQNGFNAATHAAAFSLFVDLNRKKQGAAGITTAAPYVASQLGQGG